MPPVAGPQQPNPQLERWLHYKDMILACNAGAIETGIMALKSAILLNGAAAVAVLAFISAQWKEMIEDPTQKIGRPRQLYTGAALRDYIPVGKR